jgi:hypothetical protein
MRIRNRSVLLSVPKQWRLADLGYEQRKRTGSAARDRNRYQGAFGHPHVVSVEEFVQRLADHQLCHCCKHARDAGLSIGLYLDVAVGVRPDGFDAWSDQSALVPNVAVGAPPDPLNPGQQNWGLLQSPCIARRQIRNLSPRAPSGHAIGRRDSP